MIRFNEPFISGKEKQYLLEVFENNFFSGNGAFTKRCQSFLATKYGTPGVLLTHSCTAALEMSALLLDLDRDDEVILPSYTFVSTASAFLRTGARLVFCEVDPQTMNVDLQDIARRITTRTKAIVVVHYAGIGVDVESLLRLIGNRKIVVIEDAAQGLGGKKNGRWLGTLGTFGAFSFHETKNIHCGLGGAIFVNEAEIFDRAEDVWERGTDRGKLLKGLVDKYSWVELGSSFYPSELQAAFLLAQLESFELNLKRRQEIFFAYHSRLAGETARGRFVVPNFGNLDEINYHAYFLIFDSEATCDQVRNHLKANEIYAFIGYVPLHSSKMGMKLGYRAQDLPLTEDYAKRVLRLPFHNNMSDNDVNVVCDHILKTVGG